MDPHGTMYSPPSEILPSFLYIGSKANAQDPELIKRLGITHILNVTPDMPNYFELEEHKNDVPYKLVYKRIEFDDMSHDGRLLGVIPDAAEWINSVKEQGGKILAHCYLGVSRSPALIIGYLISTGKFDMDEACAHVKSLRAASQPNLGFFEQLMIFERQERGDVSVDVTDFSKYFNVGYLNGDIQFDNLLDDYNLDNVISCSVM